LDKYHLTRIRLANSLSEARSCEKPKLISPICLGDFPLRFALDFAIITDYEIGLIVKVMFFFPLLVTCAADCS
jgi:hypothetical protein